MFYLARGMVPLSQQEVLQGQVWTDLEFESGYENDMAKCMDKNQRLGTYTGIAIRHRLGLEMAIGWRSALNLQHDLPVIDMAIW